MSSFRVKPGQKISIDVEGNESKTSASRDGSPSGDARYVGVEPSEEQLYAFRKKGNVTLYDLGTRGGVHVSFAHGDYTEGLDGSVIASDFISIWHAALMSEDFADSLKFPQHSENLWVDLVFRKEGETEKRMLVGEADSRVFLDDLSINETEEWKDATGTFTGSGEWSLAVHSIMFYTPFDVGSENFKVTSSADSAEEAVEFTVNARDKLKIYLTPRLYEFPHFVRLPVVPNFEAIKDAPIFTDVVNLMGGGTLAQGHVTPAFGAVVDAYFQSFGGGPFVSYNDTFTNVFGLASWLFAAIPPILVGIISKNNELFYIWRVGISDFDPPAHIPFTFSVLAWLDGPSA